MLNKVRAIPETSHPFGITCKYEFFTTRPAYKCGQEIGMGMRHYDKGEVGSKQIAGQTTASWLRHSYYPSFLSLQCLTSYSFLSSSFPLSHIISLSYVLLSVYANCLSRSQRLIPVNNHIGDILFYPSLPLLFNTEPSTGPWLNLICLLCSGLNLSQPFRLAITCPMCASWATLIKADRS